MIPDVTRKHWSVNIKKSVARVSRLEHLVELGSLSPQAARFLGAAVANGLNILVSGGTQAGKPESCGGTVTTARLTNPRLIQGCVCIGELIFRIENGALRWGYDPGAVGKTGQVSS